MSHPREVPSGGAFGTIGPDTGYAARLIADRVILLAPNEDRHQVEAAVVALAGARAAQLGRAPTGNDIDVALLLLGYEDADTPDAETSVDLAAARRQWLTGLGHGSSASSALVASVRPAVLISSPGEIRARRRAGEDLITR